MRLIERLIAAGHPDLAHEVGLEVKRSGIFCPKCGAPEDNPMGNLFVRAYKVDGASQCLVCSGGYDEHLVFHEDRHDPTKRWFK